LAETGIILYYLLFLLVIKFYNSNKRAGAVTASYNIFGTNPDISLAEFRLLLEKDHPDFRGDGL